MGLVIKKIEGNYSTLNLIMWLSNLKWKGYRLLVTMILTWVFFYHCQKKHCFHNPLLQGQLSHFLQYWKLIRRCCFDGQIWMIAEKEIWAFCQRFLKETMNIIDMVAICPFYISLILEGLEDFEIIGKTGKMIRLVSGARFGSDQNHSWLMPDSQLYDIWQRPVWRLLSLFS